MNNEEKILAMLEQLQTGQTALQQGQTALQAGQTALQQGQTELQAGQTALQQGQTELQAGQIAVNTRLDGMGKRLDGMDKRLESVEDILAGVIDEQKIIRESQLRVELEQFPRITAALDGNKSNEDKNKEQDKRLAGIESVVDEHSIRIFALEQAVV